MSEVSGPFWDATRDGHLMVQWCLDCDAAVFFPREVCPGCLGERLEWRRSSGTGRVHAVTVEHRPQNPLMADRAPYAVALVDVDDGWRLLSNVVGCDPLDVTVGMAVEVTWEPLSDGRRLPQFTPIDEPGA
ncbi:MAG: OB-fold domain-containing protein [Actinomycetota bacterium]|nr:OB-fold domain-containing protein [Actinomycetota bacterium]